MPLIDSGIDWSSFWTWFLLFIRGGALLISLPGIGTQQVVPTARAALAMLMAFAITAGGVRAATPQGLLDGGLMIAAEFTFGYIIGYIPQLVIGGLTVAGQVVTGSIGLGQANMIDPSLGGNFAVLARINSLLGTVIFLMMDAHHLLIRAMANLDSTNIIGHFQPGEKVFSILSTEFVTAFNLGVLLSGPLLVTILIVQFVLGLLTRFVPQFNIFIISLPLTILVGLYMTEFTFFEMAKLIADAFTNLGEIAKSIIDAGS